MALRRKIYRSIDKLQVDLDDWIDYYSGQRTHQGKCAAAGRLCKR